MKCPNCHDRSHINVVLGDGYTVTDTRECQTCGAVWYFSRSDGQIKIIKEGDPARKLKE